MNTEEILKLYNQTFNAWNVLLMVCVISGLKVAGEVFPEVFSKQPKGSPLWHQMPHRLLPVYPIILCTLCYVLVPGPWINPSLPFAQKVLLGIACGYAAGHSQAVLRRLLPEPLAALLDTKRRSSERRSGAPEP